MTERRFVLVDFRYTSGAVGHIRFYEAGGTVERQADWTPRGR
jgi:hypothetical protein